MLLCDVNVLVYAHKTGTADHSRYRRWLDELINSESAYGVSDQVLSGFIRVVTMPRLWDTPSTVRQALDFTTAVRSQPNAVVVRPGERHWDIFTSLCRHTEVKGNLVPDAFLAALAIESGSEWITTDRDYARFPGLRWRHPLTDR